MKEGLGHGRVLGQEPQQHPCSNLKKHSGLGYRAYSKLKRFLSFEVSGSEFRTFPVLLSGEGLSAVEEGLGNGRVLGQEPLQHSCFCVSSFGLRVPVLPPGSFQFF